MDEKLISTAAGLCIRPTNAPPFTVYGKVTSKQFPDDGLIYYCAGYSYQAEIVEEVLTTDAARACEH